MQPLSNHAISTPASTLNLQQRQRWTRGQLLALAYHHIMPIMANIELEIQRINQPSEKKP